MPMDDHHSMSAHGSAEWHVEKEFDSLVLGNVIEVRTDYYLCSCGFDSRESEETALEHYESEVMES